MIFFMHKQSEFLITVLHLLLSDTDIMPLWQMYEAYSNGCSINV